MQDDSYLVIVILPAAHDSQLILVGEMTCFLPVAQHIIMPLLVPEKSPGVTLPSQVGLHHFWLNESAPVNICVVTTPSVMFHLLTSLLNAFAFLNMLVIRFTFPTSHVLRSLLKLSADRNMSSIFSTFPTDHILRLPSKTRAE